MFSIKALISLCFVTTLFQLLIFSFYINDLFILNQTHPNMTDYFYFFSYTFFLYFIFKVIVYNLFWAIFKVINLVTKINVSMTKYLIFLSESLFILFFTFVDTLVYKDYGLHVYDKIVLKVLKNPTFNEALNIPYTTVFILIGILLLLVFINSVVYRLLDKRNFSFKTITIIGLSLIIWGASSAVGFNDYTKTKGEALNVFPFLIPIKGSPGQDPLELIYPIEKFSNKKLNKKKNIIFIVIESLRSDMMTAEITPKLLKTFAEKQCLNPQYVFSGGHTTEYGLFTILYSLYGLHYTDFRANQTPSAAIEILKKNNYNILGVSGNKVKGWNGSDFIFDNFDLYKEFRDPNAYTSDRKVFKWSLDQIKKQDKNFFLYMYLFSTHHNYFYPDEYEKFKPTASLKFNHFKSSSAGPKERQKIFNRYKNSVHYLDDEVDKFIKSIPAEIARNSIIVFTGDHGEEFWEEGLAGHGYTNYINPRVRVPLFICYPDPIKRKVHLSSHADIFPTILSSLSDEQENINEAFNGYNLFKEIRDYTVITGPLFPYERNKIGLIDTKYKHWLKKSTRSLINYYNYRTTDLEDNNVFDGASKRQLQQTIKKFNRDVYKFLKPITVK